MTNELRIRPASPADVPALAAIHIETWRDTYADLLPAAYLVSLHPGRIELEWQRALARPSQEFVLVGEHPDDGVVGFVSGGPNRTASPGAAARFQGEIYTLYVETGHQGEGIGRRLVAAIGERLVRREMDSVLVWVVAGNPARFFYRRLGAQQVAERRERFAGAEIDQIAFGWADIRRSIVPAGRASQS